jgi:hypothetical protein
MIWYETQDHEFSQHQLASLFVEPEESREIGLVYSVRAESTGIL